MTTETISEKVSNYKTCIDFAGQELIVHFRSMKRNEKLKYQVEAEGLRDLANKKERTPDEDKILTDFLYKLENQAIDLLDKVEGEVVIEGTEVNLDTIKSGECPEYVYQLITKVYKKYQAKLFAESVEAETKNVPPADSQSGSVS